MVDKTRERAFRWMRAWLFFGYMIGLGTASLIDAVGWAWAFGFGAGLLIYVASALTMRLMWRPAPERTYRVRNSGNASAGPGGYANTGIVRR